MNLNPFPGPSPVGLIQAVPNPPGSGSSPVSANFQVLKAIPVPSDPTVHSGPAFANRTTVPSPMKTTSELFKLGMDYHNSIVEL